MMHAKAIVTTLALAVLAGTASADFRTPNGSFTGGGQFAVADGVRVTAFRPEGVGAGLTQGFAPALEAQGFNQRNGWDIQLRTLNGGLRLDQNEAWAVNEPAQRFYGYNFGAANRPGLGGCAFAVGYEQDDGDPESGDIRWLQVIRTNSPLTWGTNHGVGLVGDVGMTWYIDNGWNGQSNPPADPFYGADDNVNATGYAANSQGMLDSPSRDLQNGVWWEAWVFAATADRANKRMTIYDGVHWGFRMDAVPTPGTLGLMAMSGIVAARRRRGT